MLLLNAYVVRSPPVMLCPAIVMLIVFHGILSSLYVLQWHISKEKGRNMIDLVLKSSLYKTLLYRPIYSIDNEVVCDHLISLIALLAIVNEENYN